MRAGLTLIELMFCLIAGLVVLMVLLGLLRSARVQDDWTSGQLDSLGTLSLAFSHLRRDLEQACSVAVDGDGAGVLIEQQRRSIRYRWGGALTRNGRALAPAGNVRGAAAGERVGLTAVSRGDRGHALAAEISLLCRQQLLRGRYPEWVPDRSEVLSNRP